MRIRQALALGGLITALMTGATVAVTATDAQALPKATVCDRLKQQVQQASNLLGYQDYIARSQVGG